MENNNNKDVLNIINEEINYILNKVFIRIKENEKINEEKCDADIKFNTLNLDDIISQVNNSNNNIFPSFDNIILSNSMNNFNSDEQNKKEPIKINNIEELLLNEEQITEIIYTYDKKYKDCFNEANILKLIDYSTHMPYISDDEIITHKYPFYSCELLKCDAPYIYEYFFNNERIISYFFDFLNDSKNNSNCVLSGYFTKIFLSLLDKKNDEIINYIFNEENLYIEQIIELCDNSSYCECIKNILILQSNKYDDKKLFIIKKLNQKIFRNEEYTNKICFEIYSSLLEEGNLIFCNFFMRNFEKIYINFKHKSSNLELFFYYIHLVRVIKECFTREKENNLEFDSSQTTRKELNTYVIKNKNIFLDFEMSLIDSLTNYLFIQNSLEDNMENKTYRRSIVSYLDILEYIIFTVSLKDNDNNNNDNNNNNNDSKNNEKKNFKYYIDKIHDIFTSNILLKITSIIFKYPLFNMLQISYIKLYSTLSLINSPLINNDTIINKIIDYLINENTGKDILLSFLVKILSIIYLSLQEQNILSNKRLKYIYECLVKNVMNIFESKLLFNQKYGSENIKNEKNKINADEIENIDLNKKDKNTEDKNTENNNIKTNSNNNSVLNNENNNFKNDDNNSTNNNCFRDIVNKGITDYISLIRFCGSSKNLNSADNISEEIDLDDFNDDDMEENDNIGNNKNFTLTSFDEIDDDEENKSDNDSIGEIFKKTAETIKSIKLRNKNNNNKELDNKKEDNIKENIKEKENKNIIKEENNIIIDNNNNNNIKNEHSEIKNKEKKIKNEKKNENKDNIIKIEEKKLNDILNKSNEKIKYNTFLESEITNTLPIIENDKENNNISTKKRLNTISHLTDNPETSNKVHVKSIFEYNNKNINVLPQIKKNSDEYDHGRYFYRDTNILSRIGSNFGEKINNFRSNNIIKNKENKECSLFQTLRKSSENGANYKYCLTIFNNSKHNNNKYNDNKYNDNK